jgi:hypothetical protein
MGRLPRATGMVVAAGAGWGRRRRREEIGFGDPMV